MNNSPHISLETLTDIAEERDMSASPETMQAAERHVAVCATCDANLQKLRRLVFLMKNDTAEDAPRDVLMSAIQVFTPQRRTPLRHIIAVLSFDSRAAGPAFGLRSIYTASRQLLYTAQETAVDLRVTVENGECHLAGQVIRDNCGGAQIELSGVTGTVNTELNELCEFTFPTIPVGNYSLRVRMPDVEIEIPELELKD